MGNDVKRIMPFPESCAPPTKKCIIKKNSCAGCKKIIFNSNTVLVFIGTSIWSAPYLQYYLMSDHRSYLPISRSCPLRSTQYRPNQQHHLHCHPKRQMQPQSLQKLLLPSFFCYRYLLWPFSLFSNPISGFHKTFEHICWLRLKWMTSTASVSYCSAVNCLTIRSQDN